MKLEYFISFPFGFWPMFRGELAVSFRGRVLQKSGATWRIIPFSKWLITMVIVSPLTGVVPLQMAVSWLINGGDPNYLQVLGAHPPSMSPDIGFFFFWKSKLRALQLVLQREQRPSRSFR